MNNMELQLKHLAPYLPYGLKVFSEDGSPKKIEYDFLALGLKQQYNQDAIPFDRIQDLTELSTLTHIDKLKIKPILHPLSDLTKPIEQGGERFVPLDRIKFNNGYQRGLIERLIELKELHDLDSIHTMFLSSWLKLFEWKFDVFGLIPAGLAIDVNTLEINPYK